MTTVSGSNPEIVMVPVPVDRLTEVYQVLAQPPVKGIVSLTDDDRLSEVYQVPGNSSEGSAVGGTRPGSTWSARDLARLDSVLGPTKVARLILNLGSAEPGHPVWFDEVCTSVGRHPASVRSELAGFTQMLRVEFGRTDWPCRSGLVDGRMAYIVDEETARAWLRHADQGQEPTT